ncbi:MAG: hypothetical protein MJ050_07980 [Phascolarctobacterium sp.]|nr:hypothetical protein [Phascolarctobacterium sp.]
MEVSLNYLIDDSCTIQDADGNIIYGVLCETENSVIDFEPHKDYKNRSFSNYHMVRNSNFYNYLERSTYGKPSDITLFNTERKVNNVFLEYRGNVYITAYENLPTGEQAIVMVKCTDNINLNVPDELRRNHNIRRFLEAKQIKEQHLYSRSESR